MRLLHFGVARVRWTEVLARCRLFGAIAAGGRPLKREGRRVRKDIVVGLGFKTRVAIAIDVEFGKVAKGTNSYEATCPTFNKRCTNIRRGCVAGIEFDGYPPIDRMQALGRAC